MNRYIFWSDYQNGAHPAVLSRMGKLNQTPLAGYGEDEISAAAREKLREACHCPDGEVFFLTGGTQTNAVVLDALLAPYQGVVAADSGHISVHEAGAIEYGRHKVLTVPHKDGKVTAQAVEQLCSAYWEDGNRAHMVMPGALYISQPTELGTLYTKEELTALRRVCDRYDMRLYLDGARLAYALACGLNDVYLSDLSRLCHVFYVGGTKCGALLGEAVVIPEPGLMPHFFTMVKQHGALLAKGSLLGIQFDALFTNGLYTRIGFPAIVLANQIRYCLKENGFHQPIISPTNQIFVTLSHSQQERLSETVGFGFWEKVDEDHDIIRLVTSWSTTPEMVDGLCMALETL